MVTIPTGKAHLTPEELVLEKDTVTSDTGTAEMESLMEELDEQVKETPIGNRSFGSMRPETVAPMILTMYI